MKRLGLERFRFAFGVSVVLISLSIVTLYGCWGSSLESYGMGRTMYYGVEAIVSAETLDRLENRFNQLLDEIFDRHTVLLAIDSSFFTSVFHLVSLSPCLMS